MATRSRIISGARALAGEPQDCPLEDGGLPMSLSYETAYDYETSMLNDLNLSDQNRTVRKVDISLNGETFVTGQSDFGEPTYAQLIIDPGDTFFPSVDIVNLTSLNESRLNGRYAVAFYGDTQEGEVSWIGEPPQQLRLWYDRLPEEDGLISDRPSISSAYHPHLKLQLAALWLELMGKPIKRDSALASMIDKGEKQWQKYSRLSRGQGLVTKVPFNPHRIGRRLLRGYGEGGFRLP